MRRHGLLAFGARPARLAATGAAAVIVAVAVVGFPQRATDVVAAGGEVLQLPSVDNVATPDPLDGSAGCADFSEANYREPSTAGDAPTLDRQTPCKNALWRDAADELSQMGGRVRLVPLGE